MGIVDGIKGIYFRAEDKWYALIDRIDRHIPVGGIVESVDRVIPSFMLFIILVVLLVGLGALLLINSAPDYEATFTVVTKDGKPVYDSLVQVNLSEGGNALRDENIRTDADGKIFLKGLKAGQEIGLNINLTKGYFSGSFAVSERSMKEKITLSEARQAPRPISRNIFLVDSLGRSVRSNIELAFYCENSGVTPSPASVTDDGDGIINVVEPVNCSKLFARNTGQAYQQKTYHINSTSYQLELLAYEAPAIGLKVKVRHNDAPVSDASFSIALTGKSTYNASTALASEATLNPVPGSYLLSVSDPKGIYGTVTKNIDINGPSEQIIAVTKTIKARISVSVLDQANDAPISDAIVSIKNSRNQTLQELKTAGAPVVFALNEAGDYKVSAKKPGDTNGGYFAKTMDVLSAAGDVSITIKLEKITNANAGKTSVKVIDQDGKPVGNAKIMLKYKENDSLVELNAQKNYVLSDLNGYATILAGKVDGLVYAYAIKYPFAGQSAPKAISLEQENVFNITMQVGSSTVKVLVTDYEAPEKKLEAQAEILTLDGQSLAGIISIEQGSAMRSIKAGQVVYVKVSAEGYEDYYTETAMLWPDKVFTFSARLKKQISGPAITLEGIYTENDSVVRTMQAGNRYYARLAIDSDRAYNEGLMHFRAGKEKLLENDWLEIDTVEAAGISAEVRGASYSSDTNDYAYDSDYITDGMAKWTNITWNAFGKGTRMAKVWFKVKKTTPPNKPLQVFWRASFDGERKPPSTADEAFYSDTYASNVYYVGQEATCDEPFCVASEWLYSQTDELYQAAPYEMRQIQKYTYHFQIVNNSGTDYSKDKKPLFLDLSVLNSEAEELRITSYAIKDPLGEITGGAASEIKNAQITAFEQDTAIDVTLELQGYAAGASSISTRLRSEGYILYTTEEGFSILSEKEMTVSVTPTFATAMVDNELTVTVTDQKGEPISEAQISVSAKEPGFEAYPIETVMTNRFGTAIAHSGSHFPKTKVLIEATKIGYARKVLELTVSDQVVVFNPESLAVQLNTVSKREEILKMAFGNLTAHNLVLVAINVDAKFEGVINEAALKSYVEQLLGTEIPAADAVTLDLIRIRLAEGITKDTLAEPIEGLEGDVVVSFEIKETSTVYQAIIPLALSVSSAANPGADCLAITNATQSKTTQQGQVSFYFEMQNACQSEGAGIGLDEAWVSSGAEFLGEADLSLQSYTSTTGGRSALDGTKRKLMGKIKAEEKFSGTATYVPAQEEIGKTITIPITIEGKFQGQTIRTTPGSLNFTVTMLNLKECLAISSDSAPMANDEAAKVTIDATKCLGQNIEVYLCKGDSGCSGGAEGKISLSKRLFTLNNSAEIIDAYSPSLPGTYGVTVWARAKGGSSYAYIGEVPVSFREPEGKYFALSKYQFDIIGEGSEDVAQLTNKMFIQTGIKVKANGCIWGAQQPGYNLSAIIGGAMMGATLGNMIGSTFGTSTFGGGSKPGTAGGSQTADERIQELETARSSRGLNDADTAELNRLTTSRNNLTAGINGLDPFDSINVYQNSDNELVTLDSSTARPSGYDYVGTITSGTGPNNEMTYTYTGMGPNMTYSSPATAANQINSNYYNTSGSWRTAAYNWSYDITHYTAPGEPSIIGGYTAQAYNWVTTPRAPNQPPRVHQAPADEYISSPTKASFSPAGSGAIYFPGVSPETVVKNAGAPVASLLTISWGGVGAGLGAVAGGLLMYLCDPAGMSYDDFCKLCQNDQIAEYKDYMVMLSGESVSVENPSTHEAVDRNVPSDAGELVFSLDGVSPSWDFSNADYSEIERVAIKMTNDGLNETSAKYGTLTINATKHLHGSDPTVAATTTAAVEAAANPMIFFSDATGTKAKNAYFRPSFCGSSECTTGEYDILCNNANFGDFWIGKDENNGLCTGIREAQYSQKYHIRIISGEPKDQESFIRKANSCYTGILAGSTGEEALPRVKLAWDWDSIQADTCDYANPDYVYCDATQFTIALTKKMAGLQEFFKLNSTLSCPEDPIDAAMRDEADEMNNETETVLTGFIGVKNVVMDVDGANDTVDAIVTVENNSGAAVTSYLSVAWKLGGTPLSDQKQYDIPAGTSTVTFSATAPESDQRYFFSATVNGPSGNRRTLTRAFTNKAQSASPSCWVETNTRLNGGMPNIMYYLANQENLAWTESIPDIEALYEHLNFGAYLMKDAYTPDFFADFKDYYEAHFLEKITPEQKKALDFMDTNNFSITKRYSGDYMVEPGLYDVWLYIGFGGENFEVFGDSNGTTIDASLLLAKSPTLDSPFYRMPFDGLVGEKSGREGYGAYYTNLTDGAENELVLNADSRLLTRARTFENAMSNGLVKVTTDRTNSFESSNASVGTRGQLAAVSASGGTADILFTPNYATPVILKYSLDGTSGMAGFSVEKNYQKVRTGGNLSYWTGAAKSRDFQGMGAIDVYYNTPDSMLEDIGDNAYGFKWADAANGGTLYLKTNIFTPAEDSYVLVAAQDDTSFWTPSGDFSTQVPLEGISGMSYNSQVGDSGVKTVQDLFEAVKEGSVCVSGDGSAMNFWWNPRVLEVTSGGSGSLADEELALAGGE